MTLKEKFKSLNTNFGRDAKYYHHNLIKCEKIADEFAIEFLKFTECTYSFGNVIGKWYLHADTSKDYTAKELLEIFKKEKGL